LTKNKTTKTQRLVTLIKTKPSTAAQIAQRCGFASKSSVTSVIASLRANGVNIRDAGQNREGFMRYAL